MYVLRLCALIGVEEKLDLSNDIQFELTDSSRDSNEMSPVSLGENSDCNYPSPLIRRSTAESIENFLRPTTAAHVFVYSAGA